MRAPYRTAPGPNNTVVYTPLIRVRLGRKRGPTTRFFEAMVDSGACDCIFHEQIGRAIGITDITTGRHEARTGISGGKEDVWIHPVILYVGENSVGIEAAFSRTLPLAGLLGMQGFFDNFKVTFDPTTEPPGLEVERIHRS